jgi:formamidopyrimidine-DNA glycosylase
MPELPEVETIVRELQSILIGKKFWTVETKLSSTFHPSAEEISKKIRNLKILDITRRGKFIIFILDQKMRLIIHLKMSGRLLWEKIKGREKHLRAIFRFTDGTSLFFSDMRKFGRIWLYPEKDYAKATGILKLGKEPLKDDFLLDHFLNLFKNRKGILKNTLLRQDILAGIGNIYADEVCFHISRHPSSRLESFTKNEIKKLYLAIRHCLEQGILHCGASVSDFVGTKGTLGKHQLYLKIYGREGNPCYTCQQPIQKTVVAGRGTFYCQKCQKK